MDVTVASMLRCRKRFFVPGASFDFRLRNNLILVDSLNLENALISGGYIAQLDGTGPGIETENEVSLSLNADFSARVIFSLYGNATDFETIATIGDQVYLMGKRILTPNEPPVFVLKLSNSTLHIIPLPAFNRDGTIYDVVFEKTGYNVIVTINGSEVANETIPAGVNAMSSKSYIGGIPGSSNTRMKGYFHYIYFGGNLDRPNGGFLMYFNNHLFNSKRNLAEAIAGSDVTFHNTSIPLKSLSDALDYGYIINSNGDIIINPDDLSVIVIGDSTIAGFMGQNYVSYYLSGLKTLHDISDPGDTIAQQKTAYLNLDPNSRYLARKVIVQIGLNDTSNGYSAETTMSEYQDFINTIKTNSPNADIITATMTPVRSRLIDAWGETLGEEYYQKWLLMNESIMGQGLFPITGSKYKCNGHTDALNDGNGNLKSIYDLGDGVHENNVAREIIAGFWQPFINLANTNNGGVLHNLINSIINFNPTGQIVDKFDIFNRSNTAIHNSTSRASSYYDDTSRETSSIYHISELDLNVINTFLNVDYQNRVFVSFKPGYSDKKYIDRIIITSESKSGGELEYIKNIINYYK